MRPKSSVLLVAILGLALAPALVSSAEAQPRRRAVVRSARPIVRPAVRPVVHTRARYYRPYGLTAWYGWPYYGWPYYGWPSYGFYPPYPYYGYGGYYGPGDATASVRIQVEPKEAQVYVDGYFAGIVDDFDGFFQRLRLDPGEHEIEIYLEGYRSIRERIYLSPGSTYRVSSHLEPLGPGEAPEPRPEPPPAPPPDENPPPGRPDFDRPPPPGGPAAAVDYGELSLRVQPAEVEVLVDGEPWPLDQGGAGLVLQLSAGRHRIEVRREGFAPFSTTVEVRPGETEVLNVRLSPGRDDAPAGASR